MSNNEADRKQLLELLELYENRAQGVRTAINSIRQRLANMEPGPQVGERYRLPRCRWKNGRSINMTELYEITGKQPHHVDSDDPGMRVKIFVRKVLKDGSLHANEQTLWWHNARDMVKV